MTRSDTFDARPNERRDEADAKASASAGRCAWARRAQLRPSPHTDGEAAAPASAAGAATSYDEFVADRKAEWETGRL